MRVSPLKDGIHRPRLAHVWIRAADDFYVEPNWCDERLFEVESFSRSRLLFDPCCGSGRVTIAARQAGYRVQVSDIVDRELFPMGRVQDFLKRKHVPAGCSVVCNPPFNLVEEFARHALALGRPQGCAAFPKRAAQRGALALGSTSAPRLVSVAPAIHAAVQRDRAWREARRRQDRLLLVGF